MKIVTTVEYTKEDELLLKAPLPHNPCDACALHRSSACCGCPEERAYEKVVKPYRDAGIYELARKMERMRTLEKQMRTELEEYSALNEELPSFARRPHLSIDQKD